MSEKQIMIPVEVRCLCGLPDAILRLTVLFPEYEFSQGSAGLEIGGVPADRKVELVQAAGDQILRSAFDVIHAGLRSRLYARLLG